MDHVLHNYLQAGAIAGVLAGAGESISDAAATTPRKTRLLHDFVVLRFPDLPKEHRVGDVAIALPDKRYFESTMRDATVVAVGPGKWVEATGNRAKRERFHPMQLRVGDRVLLNSLKTQIVGNFLDSWDGERGDFRMVRESDVDGVLEPDCHVEVA